MCKHNFSHAAFQNGRCFHPSLQATDWDSKDGAHNKSAFTNKAAQKRTKALTFGL